MQPFQVIATVSALGILAAIAPSPGHAQDAALLLGRGSDLNCVTTGPVPASITGPDRLTVPMAAIRKRVPDAVDAFTSPNGSVAVVLGPKAAWVFRVASGCLGPELGAAPIPTSEVEWTSMARWATGSSVRRWDRELAPVLPTVLVVSGGKGATVR